MSAPADVSRRHHDPSAPDAAVGYRLDERVAIRPEPFGALVYHYGNRRLVFLRSPQLVDVVRSLDAHPTAESAMSAAGVPAARQPAFRQALDSLERAEVIHAR